jgi:alpha-ribazole phosphatase
MGESIADMTIEFLLVRHGESEWNKSSRYTGQQDVPLSALGKQQARQLALRLADEHLAAVYASPLRRARETAEIIARQRGWPVRIDQGLAEIHHGLWEGMTTRQVMQEYPSMMDRWRSQPHTVVMPQGESLKDVALRVDGALERIIIAVLKGKVMICSHDAVLRVLVSRCLGMGLKDFWKWDFENASLTILHGQENMGRYSFRLDALNDTAHLGSLASVHALQAL